MRRPVQVYKYKTEEKEVNTINGLQVKAVWVKDANDQYVKEPDFTGWCLGFTTEYEELNSGVGQSPMAIIEKEDGNVETTPLHLFKFINDPAS